MLIATASDIPLARTGLKPFALLSTAEAEEVRNEIQDQISADVSIEDAYPCSPLQEGLFALSMKQEGKYVVQLTYRLPADFNLQIFQAAWQTAVNANGTLRTRIIQTKSTGLIQVVLKNQPIEWLGADNLAAYTEREKQTRLGFGSNLLRYGIVDDIASGFKYFVMTVHHVIIDGWSLRLLLKQVDQAYQRIKIDELVEFNHFISYLMNVDTNKANNFWCKQLANIGAVTFPSLPSPTYLPVVNNSIKRHIRVPHTLTSVATIPTIIQAAWALLIAKHTNKNDVVFGLVLAGRNIPVPGIEKINGPTFTTVPMRVLIDLDSYVGDYFLTIRKQKSEMKSYQHSGLQNIRRLGSDGAAACTFQNLLVIQPLVERDRKSLFDSRVGQSDNAVNLNAYGLALQCSIIQDGFVASIDFDMQMISTQRADLILNQFEYLVIQLTLRVNDHLSSFGLPGPQNQYDIPSRDAQLEEVQLCVHEWIEKRSFSYPTASAISSWDGELTYHQVNMLSSRLAHRLRGSAVGPEVRVGLLFEKSMWTVIAMLAVMKAGGVFVPLDPTHPKKRIESVLQDVEASVLLCSNKYFNTCTNFSNETIVVSTASLEQFPVCGSIACNAVKPNNAVYIMFTSGSTGKPKGCVLEHVACCSSLTQLIKTFDMNSNSRFLQFSSYAFDGSILEILATLAVGGCVCVPSDEEKLNYLDSTINKMQINFAFLTPSVARLINPKSVPLLTTLMIGGEKVVQEDLDRWIGRLRLFNVYGPTECCVMCIAKEIKNNYSKASNIGTGTIGDFLITDEKNQMVPVGTIGELLIGGPNLARGYFNDLEKTATAFLEYPACPSQRKVRSSRFYRTGDLVKHEPDGTIDFVGRKDAQIKLRGQRIEIGEIEHNIQKNVDGVLDAVVELINPLNEIQPPFLAAFVSWEHYPLDTESLENSLIANESSLLSKTAEIPIRLSTLLPQYMIPSVFIPMRSIPLAISGKTDHRKLQSLVADLTMEELAVFSGEKRIKKAPVTENEISMHHLWAEMLNLQPDMIGIYDSFLQLGGDSILAMRLVTAARGKGLYLTVADVFRNPRLCDLASVATNADRSAISIAAEIAPFALVPESMSVKLFIRDVSLQYHLNVELIEDLYPCTPFQEGIMVLSVRRAGSYVAQHIFELSAGLRLDLAKFCTAWETVAELNPILRTRIIQTESVGLMQVVIKEKIQWVFQSDIKEFIRKDKAMLMGFGTPLVRYAIITPAAEQNDKCYFVLTMHHAVYDAYSLKSISNQVGQMYQKLKSAQHLHSTWHKPSNQPSNQSIPFNSFIKALQDRDVSKAQDFWSAQYRDGEPSTYPSSRLSSHLSRPNASLVSKIEFTRKLGSDITSSTIIWAAWAILIGKYAKSDDVFFGATLSGRTDSIAHMDRVMGPTLTTVPVRICVDPLKPIADFLHSVQKQNLEIVSFAHIGVSNIGMINADTKSACAFQNLLIIQPREESNPDETFLSHCPDFLIDARNFDTYPLTLECQLTDSGLIAKVFFDADVIDKIQMKRILFQLQHILQQLCLEKGDKIVQDIVTISPEDVQEIWAWNSTLPEKAESCVHHLIEQVVHKEPHAPAVCSHDGDLKYNELDNLSSRLAKHLIRQGIGIESKVPILFEKSKWAVVAILAIMKAGGAFVPLDPAHPKMRLVSILDQIKATALLCSTKHAHLCSILFSHGKSIVVNDSEIDQLPDGSDVPSAEVCPSNSLYIIFTSGTTGSPKGTVIEHGAYCSGARDHAKALHFDHTCRVLQFASYSFDTGVEDILTSLLVGACICIPSENERNSDLIGAIKRMEVTNADLTPSLIHCIEPDDVSSLRNLTLGGEPLTSKVIKTWASRLRLMNAYGTTECSVTNFVNSEITPETDPMNIGFAVGGVGWIVEAMNHDRLAPIGTIGELLIEGPTLARGYLNDENKTNAAFIEAPAWAHSTPEPSRPKKLYKTGDLAQYNKDGSISYVGRKDSQVKIRGQRIELDEVEHHLTDYPYIKSAIAVLPSSGPRKDCLAAVVEFRSFTNSFKNQDIQILENSRLEKQGIKWFDLSIYLSDRVPSYMIPTAWIAVENMPLHSSGKLDRSKLSSWLAGLPVEHTEVSDYKDTSPALLDAHESTAFDISVKVAELVSNGSSNLREAIAGFDVKLSNFGIDSIRVMTLAAFIKRSYGVTVEIQKLLGNRTTVRDIAKQIFEAKAGIYQEPFPPIDLMNEFSILDTQLSRAQNVQAQLRVVFLTGATGYLGTQLLRQLLTRSDVEKVIAHVRASNPEDGRQRVMTSAKLAKWWSEEFSCKLEIWIGDLAQPKIGLSLQQWKLLSEVDAIIHNGASVHWNADYHALKSVNVISTMELLMMIQESNPQPKFCYVSGGRDFGDKLSDSEIAAELAPLEGYSQTKFMAEMLVKHFSQRQVERSKISVIKPGLIIGTIQEGIANVDDFIWRLAAGAARIKRYPQEVTDSWLSVSSGERVAEVILSKLDENATAANNNNNNIIKISDGTTTQEFWTILNTQLNHELQPVSYSEWINLLQQDIDSEKESHPIWPVSHLLSGRTGLGSPKPSTEVSMATSEHVKAAIAQNVKFLIEIGFLRKGRERSVVGGNSSLAFKRT